MTLVWFVGKVYPEEGFVDKLRVLGFPAPFTTVS